MLDTLLSIETPEGIDFDLIPSGPVARILAYLSDFLIRGLVLFVIGIVLGSLGAFGAGIMLLCYFVLEWLYPVFFEVTRGATPGKKWMNLRVVQDDGTPITLSSSMLRNLLRSADILPFFYVFGLIAMLCNKSFKRLGDLAAETLVIQLAEPMPTTQNVKAEPIPPDFLLNPDQQKAVIQFTLRAEVLTQSRQAELADILGVALGPSPQRVARLQQMGAYLLGKTASPVAADAVDDKDDSKGGVS